MAQRLQSAPAYRSYSLRIDAELYVLYQELARGLDVTLSRMFSDALEYALNGGAEVPEWWDQWQAQRSTQDPLIELEEKTVA